MTSEIALPDLTGPGPQACYRHPDRETWVRCGRCDRPICTGCAMQGPVGLRCKDCGKPVRDAFTSMTAQQMLLAIGLPLGAGLVVGYLAMQFGWFALVLAFFAGRFIVDVLDRTNGIKRGPRMVAMVVGGLLVGTLAGGGLGVWMVWQEMVVAMAGEETLPFEVFIGPMLPQVLIAAGASVAGAIAHLR